MVWTYAGVRPLVDDGSGKPEAATRGYRFDLSPVEDGAPILSVFGGKITTYRVLAQEAVDRMGERISELSAPHWTDRARLPGGDFGVDEVDARIAELRVRYPFLEPRWAQRLFRAYGTNVSTILGEADRLEDCGKHFGQGLTELEVRYLAAHEWADDVDDVLWRRSKLGLHLNPAEQGDLRRFSEEELVNVAAD